VRLERIPFGLLALFATLGVLAANLAGSMAFELLDVDEPRFATASRHLLRSGDWLVPWFNGAERLDKPILVYWLQAACMALFSSSEFAARLPSALAVAAAVPATACIGRALGLRAPFAVIAGAAVGTGGAAQALAHGATADATLLGIVTWTCKLMVDVKLGRAGPVGRVLVWVLLALAFLTKGPPALVAPLALAAGMFAAGWRPRLAALLAGVVLAAAIVAAWAVPALIRTEGRFWTIGVMHHVVDRSLRPFEGHGGHAPWWYLFYVGAVPLAFLPWTPFLLALRRGLRLREQAAPGTARLLGAWFLVTLLVFSLATSKLAHYPLPAFPALAIAMAFALQAQPIADRWLGGALIALGVLVGGVTIAAFSVLGLEIEVPALLTGAALLVGFAGAGRLAWRGELGGAGLAMAFVAIAGFGGFAAFVAPALLEHGAAHAVQTHKAEVFPPERRVATYALSMPSLVFYLDREVPALDPGAAVQWLLTSGQVLVTTRDKLAQLDQAIAALDEVQRVAVRALVASPRHVLRGFLPNKGKLVDLLVLGS
jgi:4-amino-4-deoxy-L-arabinose transferase-like glycosyltransferase